jgi:hypothetical protein
LRTGHPKTIELTFAARNVAPTMPTSPESRKTPAGADADHGARRDGRTHTDVTDPRACPRLAAHGPGGRDRRSA